MFRATPPIHQMAKIPKSSIRFQAPTAWSTGTVFKGRPKWDVLFFADANSKRLDQYLDATELRHGLQNMMRETRQSFDSLSLQQVLHWTSIVQKFMAQKDLQMWQTALQLLQTSLASVLSAITQTLRKVTTKMGRPPKRLPQLDRE